MKKVTFWVVILASFIFTGSSAFSAETIRIGVPLAMTGAYAGSGDNYWKGIEMATNEINGNGGLLGKQIEIIRFDSQEFAPEVVMQGANYLCGKMKVASVHAGWAGWGQDILAYGKYDAPFFCDDGAMPAVEVYKKDPVKYNNTYFITDTGGDQANSMFNMLTALPYEYPNKKILTLINKSDSLSEAKQLEVQADQPNWILISAKQKTGLDDLLKHLVQLVNTGALSNQQTVVSNSRHFEALNKAFTALNEVQKGMDQNISSDLMAIDIRQALFHLGEITGEITTDDLLGNIFANFCIGK